MKAIYLNYLLPYAKVFGIGLLTWLATFFTGGFIFGLVHFLAFIFMGVWFFFGLPVLVYLDYRKAKKYLAGNPSNADVISELVIKLGVPEVVAKMVVNSVLKK